MITGAGRGLGSVLAAAFDAAGARLALVARSKPALEDLAGRLAGDHLVCAGDVRDELFNETVAERMTERFGGVDVWIANAGVSREDPDITKLSAGGLAGGHRHQPDRDVPRRARGRGPDGRGRPHHRDRLGAR